MGSSCSKCCGKQATDSNEDPKWKQTDGAFSPTASSSSSGRENAADDHFQGSTFPRDSSIGINRLARVSAQFLPPDGSRTVKVPTGNFDLRYSFLSQRGYYPEALDKPNQDSFCIHTPFGTNPDDHFFGVFDGHGEFGAQCSQFAKRKLCENLLRNSRFRSDPVEACHAAFLATNSQLHADPVDDDMSGTTAIVVLLRGRTIYVANCGDSRAVIAENRGKETVAVDLSVDQTPFRADEQERVKKAGARVLTLDQIEGLKNPDVQCWGTEDCDDGDPPRVWVPNGMYPGTAFTRSIGDFVAESIGVVAMPEIIAFELTQDHPFFVLASDGVFEFLSSQAVVDMVSKFKDPRDACAAIVAESYRLWLQYETRTDDITIIVVQINGLVGTASSRTTPNNLRSLHSFTEVPGPESPSAVALTMGNLRARHDLSRARLRAIESSLDSGLVWAPPSPSQRKSSEEEVHIERVLRDHFLFRKLTDSQSRVLLDCMHRVKVNQGDIIVQQGGEGECFYIVGSGEFEVFATQVEDGGQEVIKVLHKYTAKKLSSFGELALMYNKPLQASVRAVTSGTLWSLKREDFRGILMSKFSNLPLLKILRSIELFSKLTILQLKNISDVVEQTSFSDGQQIVERDQYLPGMYIVLKGQVKMTYDDAFLQSPNLFGLPHESQKDNGQRRSIHELLLTEGSHFGDWTLLGEKIESLTAVAVGQVVCGIISKEKFESAIGPLPNPPSDDQKSKKSLVRSEDSARANDSRLSELRFSDLEWRKLIHATDCSDLGLIVLNDSEELLTLKRFSKKRVKQLGREKQVIKERDFLKSLSHLTYVPKVLCTLADNSYLGILLKSCLSCSLLSILHKPLDENSARFCAASVVVALEELHKNSIIYRGISPEILMFNRKGHLQLVDFRFAKKLDGKSERTYTICGIADSLSPEILQGRGHGLAADWWAVGVLIHFMLQVEMPFGTWREGELETFSKIAKGRLNLRGLFNPEAVDLISKLLEVDESIRLGGGGAESVKRHPWFREIVWEEFEKCTATVPEEITTRIELFMESHSEGAPSSLSPPSPDHDQEVASQWIEGW
ncbi:protein phosphatase 2C and cyclic nucleotide-binding/kinase domain-containing protein [Wolffia australiana]